MLALDWNSLRAAFFSGNSGPSLRPIAQISFAFNHFLNGFDPFAFKTTNLVIHFLTSLLVFTLARRVFQAASHRSRPLGISTRSETLAASTTALIWALHPVQLLVVLHAVQRMTSLSAFFLLAALLLHIRARDRALPLPQTSFLTAWLLLWPLSILSKENGILFPYFVLLFELFFKRNADGRIDRFTRYLAWTCALSGVITAVYLLSSFGHWIFASYELRPFSLSERLLTESRVLWFYLGLLLTPSFGAFALHHDDISISTNLFSPPTTFLALICWLLVVFAAWRWRRNQPLFTFGVLWFLVGHALESTFLPLEIAYEHRNYLPSFGIFIAVVGAFMQMPDELQRISRIALPVFTAACIAYLSLLTALRSNEFSNTLLQTQMEAENHPYSARAHSAAGAALAELPLARNPQSPIHAFARKHFEQATRLSDTDKSGLFGQIRLDCAINRLPNQHSLDELAKRLGALPFAPGDRNILFRIKEDAIAGSHCLDASAVQRLFQSSLGNPSVSPGVRAIILSWYADYLWLVRSDMVAAQESLRESLRIAPTVSSNALKLAQLHYLAGENTQAKQLLATLSTTHLSVDELATMEQLRQTLGLAESRP